MKRIREQLTCYGGKELSDEDLLTLILCTGAGGKQRTPRIPHLGSDPLQHLLQADVGQLVHVYGLGKVKAIQLQAVLELARRIMRPLGDTGYQINHPSGDPTPSPEDIDVTHQLVEAGKLLDIELLDHLVIGNCHFISLKEQLRW